MLNRLTKENDLPSGLEQLIDTRLNAALGARRPAGDRSFEAGAAAAVQAADAKIEKCMADSRASYPDATAHDKRILTATQCICTQAPDVCNHSQMIQDFRLQQRVVEGK